MSIEISGQSCTRTMIVGFLLALRTIIALALELYYSSSGAHDGTNGAPYALVAPTHAAAPQGGRGEGADGVVRRAGVEWLHALRWLPGRPPRAARDRPHAARYLLHRHGAQGPASYCCAPRHPAPPCCTRCTPRFFCPRPDYTAAPCLRVQHTVLGAFFGLGLVYFVLLLPLYSLAVDEST